MEFSIKLGRPAEEGIVKPYDYMHKGTSVPPGIVAPRAASECAFIYAPRRVATRRFRRARLLSTPPFISFDSPPRPCVRVSKRSAYFQNTLRISRFVATRREPLWSSLSPSHPACLSSPIGEREDEPAGASSRSARRFACFLFVTLIRVPDEPQCLAYFVTERNALPVVATAPDDDRISWRRIRNYPYSR